MKNKTILMGTPYPLRWDRQTDGLLAAAEADSGLKRVEILRMSLNVGLERIDWRAYKSPLLKPEHGAGAQHEPRIATSATPERAESGATLSGSTRAALERKKSRGAPVGAKQLAPAPRPAKKEKGKRVMWPARITTGVTRDAAPANSPAKGSPALQFMAMHHKVVYDAQGKKTEESSSDVNIPIGKAENG